MAARWCYCRRWNVYSVMLLLLLLVTAGMNMYIGVRMPVVYAASRLEQAFASAASDYEVPEPLLKSLCYMEGHLSNHGGRASMDNGYGCMHLMMNGHMHALSQAATLLHVDAAKLKTSLPLNIRGGAAVLHAYQRQLVPGVASRMTLRDWYPVIAAYSGATDRHVAQMYADALFALLRSGFYARAETGELVTLQPQNISMPVQTQGGLIRSGDGGAKALKAARPARQQRQKLASTLLDGCVSGDQHTDYPDAVDCILPPSTYDCNVVKGDAPCTYESAQRPDVDLPIQFVVIHDIEGTAKNALASFRKPKSRASIHYIVDSDGTVYQIVHESDIAYHAGNYWYNQRAIGIEHAGYASAGYSWYNATLYLSSARLTAYLLNKYHIPLDHDHILGHGTIPSPTLALSPNHVDPGPYWMWDYYFDLIHRQGVPLSAVSDNSSVVMLSLPTDIASQGSSDKAAQNYHYFALYDGPSTDSGLIPQASGSSLDETGNIEPGVSYVVTDMVPDPAGSGKMLYQIWYGVASRLHDKQPSKLASARQVWLAADPALVTRGHGVAVRLNRPTQIYGQPDTDAHYLIGDAPAGAVFVSPFVLDGNGGLWFAINFNHRQAWVPFSALD
jgi:hypothetical protein